MLIPPKYQLTSKISKLLSEIEASKEVINSVSIPTEIENNIRRKSTLNSSLFSARIEGNTLTLDDLPITSSSDQKKKEVYNILKALNWIHQRRFKDFTAKDILTLHNLAMDGLVEKPDLGKFRTNMEAIFNSAGIAIYLPPRPSQVPALTQKLLKFINSNKESFVPIKACLAHYTFEKIHPFLDGSGRVGRLLIQAILEKSDYGMKGLVTLEEYLDNHRSDYYQALDDRERDVTEYLEFMLEAIAYGANQAKQQILQKHTLPPEDYLLPRRAEILAVIKDHQLVNFDMIRRRFLAVPERTLSYDLKKLQDSGLIRKRGTTKGVFYEPTT